MTARRGIEPEESGRGPARLRGWIAVLVSLVIVVGGAVVGWVFARDAVRGWFEVADYPGPGGAEVVVTIPKGASLTRIGELLAEADVVASGATFVKEAAGVPEASTIQAGSFRLPTRIPARTAIDLLLDPANAERNTFMLREGGWLVDHVEAMATASGLPASSFEELLADPEPLGLPEWAGGNPEGVLFPDTYELPSPVDAAAMIQLATARFNQVTESLNFTQGAQEQSVTPLEALTVASIVEREVARAEDRPRVARVIYNRLAEDMPLQMDSTVHFATGTRGSVWTSDDDRGDDSPYNTYKHKGLPPGPISSPGEAALASAIDPAEGDWLYFVAVNLDTGETKFSSSYAEHEAAVEELQAWCRASEANRAKCR